MELSTPGHVPSASVGARQVGAIASLGAFAALMIGGTLMAIPVESHLGLLGPVMLAAISVFDVFTLPALHERLRGHAALVLIATGCALIGDLLGVVARLIQTSAVAAAGRGLSESAQTLDIQQQVLNTGGFLLVSVSFTAFGVLFMKAGARLLGIAGLAAGVLTSLGQFPTLEVAFYVANLAYLTWYAALYHALKTPRT